MAEKKTTRRDALRAAGLTAGGAAAFALLGAKGAQASPLTPAEVESLLNGTATTEQIAMMFSVPPHAVSKIGLDVEEVLPGPRGLLNIMDDTCNQRSQRCECAQIDTGAL